MFYEVTSIKLLRNTTLIGGNLVERKAISEYGIAIESIKIEAFQSASLVVNTKRLSEMVCEPMNIKDISCLAEATVLMGAAALEALLSEVAYLEKPELYEEMEFRRGGFKKKIILLKGKDFFPLCYEANKLWEYRKALAHSEPINERTTMIGKIINVEGAQWVYKTLEKFSRIIWDSKMPLWFSETTGINNPK